MQHAQVLDYLAAERLVHGGLAEEPDWCTIPYVAIWAIRSVHTPDAVGWWAISGDVPTDYIAAHRLTDARAAARAISLRWMRAADDMAAGRENAEYQIGTPAKCSSLAPLLSSRAALLWRWTDDDEVWE